MYFRYSTLLCMTPDELRTARLALNWTQAELGEALGVTVTTVARWERGERPIPSFLDASSARVVLRLERELRKAGE